MHRALLTALAATALASAACINEREYVSVSPNDVFAGPFATGVAALRGDVGEVRDIDNSANDIFVDRSQTTVGFSGNVPHQAQMSTIYLDVRIANVEQLAIGQQLRQEGVKDAWGVEPQDGPVLDVYVCPNGEGISGNADDIVVTRTGPESFTFVAASTIPEQNLDVDLDFTATP